MSHPQYELYDSAQLLSPRMWEILAQHSLERLMSDDEPSHEHLYHLRVIVRGNPSLLNGSGVVVRALNIILEKGWHGNASVREGIPGLGVLCDAVAWHRQPAVFPPNEVLPVLEQATTECLEDWDRYESRTFQVKERLPQLFELLMYVSNRGFAVIEPHLEHPAMTHILTRMSGPRLIFRLKQDQAVLFYRELLGRLLKERDWSEEIQRVFADLSLGQTGFRILQRAIQVAPV